MNRIAPALVAATLLLAPAVVRAQSLGEVAEKEKEKKDKDKSRKPAKSYTEEDLRGKLGGTMSNPGATASVPGNDGASSSTAGAAKEGADGAPATETAAPSAEELEAKQAEWRARKGRIEGEIVRINASINSFQARLADNTVPMYGPGRESLVQNLERAKADLVRATADLASAEQEGRTNGYRP